MLRKEWTYLKMQELMYMFTILITWSTMSKGNVIQLNNQMNKHGAILREEEFESSSLKGDGLVLDNGDGGFIQIDRTSGILETDSKLDGLRSLDHHRGLTYVKHFARHGLCRSNNGKRRFYIALKSQLCHSKGIFIIQLVEDMCAEQARCSKTETVFTHPGESNECGRTLYDWVSELFDLNGDGFVDHFERQFYEYKVDD